MAVATTTIEGKTFTTNKSSIDFNPSAGVLRVIDELLFQLPFNVGVSVEVKDRAGEDVPAAKVTLLVNGNDRTEGRSATLKVGKKQTVAARVEFAPLNRT